jgi:glycosyltransferase involved in cell wall biosynthesis
MANRLGIGATVRALDVPDEAWPAVFRGASALLHGGRRRNTAALRWALASGLPVAAASTPITDSVLGPAGFLVPDGNSRSLGAACLTMLVEDEVAGSLRARGLERAASYRTEGARAAWLEAVNLPGSFKHPGRP